MRVPEPLVPSRTQLLQLPRYGPVTVAKATPLFNRWSGLSPGDTYNGKEVLDCAGRPAFAELAILWMLQSVGWEGVWIDSYARVFRTGYWNTAPVADLPPAAAAVVSRIGEAAGSRFGAWDVFCWNGRDVLFAESKRAGRDRVRDTQVRWLQGALDVGLSIDQFLVVEWSLA